MHIISNIKRDVSPKSTSVVLLDGHGFLLITQVDTELLTSSL